MNLTCRCSVKSPEREKMFVHQENVKLHSHDGKKKKFFLF